MNWDVVLTFGAGIVRHSLTAVGVWLAGHGAIDCGTQALGQCSGVQAFVGAGMVILGVAWSWWQKAGQAKVAAMLKKVTNKPTTTEAVEIAETLPRSSAVRRNLP